MNLEALIAANLERAKLELAESEALHAAAVAKVAALQGRIEAAVIRQSEITLKRLDGAVTEAENVELAALDHDLEALESMHSEAVVAADRLKPDSARNRVAAASDAWERHQAQQTTSALLERAKELEARLVDCLAELAQRASVAGHGHFREVWEPSAGLQTLMLHTRFETIAGLRRAA
jgi:hypothetical protein